MNAPDEDAQPPQLTKLRITHSARGKQTADIPIVPANWDRSP